MEIPNCVLHATKLKVRLPFGDHNRETRNPLCYSAINSHYLSLHRPEMPVFRKRQRFQQQKVADRDPEYYYNCFSTALAVIVC